MIKEGRIKTDRFWTRKGYDMARRLVVMSVISIYTGLICFSIILHNHPIDISEETSSSFAVSNQGKDNQRIDNVKVISQRQSIPCLACAFENNNKASGLQAFIQTRSNYSSTACLSFQTIFQQSFLLKSFQTRAPPKTIS